MKFTVRNVPCLPYITRIPEIVFNNPGETFDTQDFPEMTMEDVSRWHGAGFIHIDGIEDGKEPKPTHTAVSPT